MRFFARSRVGYGDGKFTITPPLFKDLNTLHEEYFGHIFPFALCVLSRRRGEVYTDAFQFIRDRMMEPELQIELNSREDIVCALLKTLHY